MNLLQKVGWSQFVGAAGWDIWIFGSFSFPLHTCQPHAQSWPQSIFDFFSQKLGKVPNSLKMSYPDIWQLLFALHTCQPHTNIFATINSWFPQQQQNWKAPKTLKRRYVDIWQLFIYPPYMSTPPKVCQNI